MVYVEILGSSVTDIYRYVKIKRIRKLSDFKCQFNVTKKTSKVSKNACDNDPITSYRFIINTVCFFPLVMAQFTIVV